MTKPAHVVWTKPETIDFWKARRKLYLLLTALVELVAFLPGRKTLKGCVPGQGLGPGEGWSGAIANGQTDIWYSYIAWDDFDKILDVTEDDGEFDSLEILDFATYYGIYI